MGDAQIRANFAASIKRIHNYTEATNFTNATLEDVQVRLNRLETVWTQFDTENGNVLLNLTSADESDAKLNAEIYAETEEMYLEAKVTLTRKVNELTKSTVDSSPAAAGVTHDNCANESHRENITVTFPNRSSNGLQIAPERLPNFHGDYAQWPNFRDLFTRLVDQDEIMIPLAKFNALDNHLKGEPAALIAGIKRVNANYKLAWKTVFDTYENPQLIVNSLIDSLQELRPMDQENAASLRFVITKYRSVTQQLATENIDVTTWDPILRYNLSNLLDPATQKAWEFDNAKKKSTSLEFMLAFLEERVTALLSLSHAKGRRMKSVAVRPQQHQQQQQNYNRPRSSAPTIAHVSTKYKLNGSSNELCPVCKGRHGVSECEKFLKLNCFPRMQRARSLRLCFGCLASDHSLSQCDVPVCTICSDNRRHHELLCFTFCDQQKSKGPLCAFVNYVIDETKGEMETMLATAVVQVRSASDQLMMARALCDNGGQANLITEDFVRRLRIHRRDAPTDVTPIGDTTRVAVRGMVTLIVSSSSLGSAYQIKINALVMRRISPSLPQQPLDIGQWPSEVMDNLADPTLDKPGQIDLLLGARVWSQIIVPNIHRSNTNELMAQDSQLGWLILGATGVPKSVLVGTLQVSEKSQLNETIQRFWELESIPEEHHRSAEEQFCADVFERETFRNDCGQYVVSIPIDPNAALLGDSRKKALQRFFQIENRFSRDPEYHREYVDFMRDYLERGHMSLVEEPISTYEEYYFIPHHGIISERKKFRVVFDGSAQTTSGQSLNDIQMKGERLQDNLADIILRFRLHEIALTADVQQMYRQILINESQRNLQLIFFRENPLNEIKIYRLNTVTYGLKHAPHSAVSALQRCASDHLATHTAASAVAFRDFYMDDLSTGGDTVGEVTQLYHEMKSMMNSGGFPLRKWATNNWNVISAFDEEDIPKTDLIEFKSEEVRSVLGTYWNPMADEFLFTIHEFDVGKKITKRIATSELAKLFDPTGLLAAVIARGKLLIRQLWLQKIDWDEKVAEPMLSTWLNFFESLKCLAEIRIPRWIGSYKKSKIELHGFCDASEAMYAAVVYYRVVTRNEIRCGILSAKTKVAPLKTISIPRLELCGALLVSRLMTSIKNALRDRQEYIECYYWTDATIVLAWLMQSPHSLKTFVAHRVKKIQDVSKITDWQHVRSQANPADLASRGIDASELVNNNLWWHGPNWLSLPKSKWPRSQSSAFQMTESDSSQMESERKPLVIALVNIESFWIADRFSTFTRLCLVTAFVMRFIRNCRAKANGKRQIITIEHLQPLARVEYQEAETFWLSKSQSYDFPNEIKACEDGIELQRSSKLFGLSPFLDSNRLLRVGGRLANAPLPYAAKYPIILDGHSRITKLIIKRTHLEMLHGGAQLTTRTVREKYWIVGGRNAIRHVIHNCLKCVAMRAQTCTQQMANLVEERVTPEKPFTNTSLDYCGPFEVKRFTGRCRTLVKVWVSVFICMATRAIHLELVHDLTSDAFIDAFQRFAARRGYCAQIISDNAKTFVGAKRQILEIEEIFKKSAHSHVFSTRGIEWKFIMPRSPSQGGSHEVAVKLFKHHLWRVMGSNVLSVIELESLMIRIEGCLNSRPLAIQSDDPNDHIVVTPAQLISGYSLVAAPPVEPILENEPITNHHLRKIQYWHQNIWRQWQSDYINNLQCRGRWQNKQPNVKVDDIVLIKEDNLAPQHWLMGKIIEVHPGRDGCVRNVTLKCGSGSILKRAVQKLCKLPVGQDVMALKP